MNQVTLFNNLLSTQSQPSTLQEVFKLMREDEELIRLTELHRNGLPQKQKVPVFVPSAILQGGRRQEHILELTGMMYFDFDHLTEWELSVMTEDILPYLMQIVGFHRSLSGQGLHVIVAYKVFYHDMEPMPLSELKFGSPEHAQRTQLLWNAIWEDVRSQFEEILHLYNLSVSVDKQCKDVARASAMAFDPCARIFRDNAFPFTVILSRALLDYGGSKPHTATGNPVGRPSKTAVGRIFDAAEAFAKSQGLEPRHGVLNKFVSTVIYQVNRYGVELEEALTEAKSRYYYYGDGKKGISSIVNSIYKNKASEHGTLSLPSAKKKQSGAATPSTRATSADIEEFLLRQGSYRRNVITHRLEVQWAEDSPMTEYHKRRLEAFSLLSDSATATSGYVELLDSDVSTLMRLLFDEKGLKVLSPAEVFNVLSSDTCSKPYNPIFSYLLPLKERWKPGDKDYLHELIQTVEVEGGDETRALLDDFFVRWFVGMVHGWIHMSSTHGTILTFIGNQGVGKSSWMRMLLPPELRSMYKEQMRFRNLDKDDRIQLAECCLINLEEIDALSDADANQLKALVTLDKIRERLPYGRTPQSMPRIATFCATGNRADFLTDPTGNRRWLAFSVRRFTINPFDYQPDYAGIYAQALYLAFNEPKRFVMSQQDIMHLDQHNEQYVSQTVEVELCGVYVHPGVVGTDGKPLGESKWLTAAQVAQRIAYYNPFASLSNRNIGMALKRQGLQSRISKGTTQYLVILD